MQRTAVSGLFLSLVLVAGGTTLRASEADEFRERAEALQHKAAIAAKEGLEEAAEQMRREAAKLRDAAAVSEKSALAEKIEKPRKKLAERPAAEKEMRQLKERLEDLRAQERKVREIPPEEEFHKLHQHIAATEHKLQQIARHAEGHESPTEKHAPQEQLEHARRRIHHMRVAAENLKLAEMPDLAEQVAEKAEATERELQEAAERMTVRYREAMEKRGESESDRNRDLHEAIERLRAEVKELRQKIEEDR